jgi:hypothetical protein
LFGPGVIDVVKAKRTRARNVSSGMEPPVDCQPNDNPCRLKSAIPPAFPKPDNHCHGDRIP